MISCIINKYSIKDRLYFLGYITLIIISATLSMDIYIDRYTLYNERHKNLDKLSDQAITILKYYNKRYLAREISLAEAKTKAKKLLDKISYGPTNGYFIIEFDESKRGNFALIGHSNKNIKDSDIPKIGELLKQSQETGRPVEILLNRGESNEYKIFQAKFFEPWNWIVGTGQWASDLEEYFLDLTIKKVSIVLPIILILIIFLYIITRSIISPLNAITDKLKILYGNKRVKRLSHQNTEFENIFLLMDAINAINSELNNRITEITLLNARLTKQNLELSDFASVIWHDLQAPLRKIGLLISTLEQPFNQSSRSQHYKIYQIKEIINYTKRLLSDILQFSQLSTVPLQRSDISLKDCIRDAIKLNDIYLKDITHKITLGDLLNIKADRTLMTQVFFNLINNSIKYRKTKDKLEIHIDSESRKGTLLVSVKDNGMGLKSASPKYIFMPFKRGNHTKIRGKGLGLSICKKIITKHNGNIWAENSKNDAGLTIKFTIRG